MKPLRCVCLVLITALATVTTAISAPFPPQQHGAFGRINRMIVNHNANNDEIYITTDDPAPPCPQMVLRTNDPNVSPTSYKTLYAYLLTAKITAKRLDFYTDLSCNLFRVEMLD